MPLGAFLSGGVDSSAVVAMMAKASAEPVNTCSIAFADPAFDESRYAQQVADRYRTRHFVERVESDDFDLIDTLARVYDEPYADSSAIPTYRVCQLARKHVTVALSGDGGDENFGGYRRYRLHLAEERMRRLLPLSLRRPVFGLLGSAYPKADWAPRVFRAKSTFEALARDSVEAYFHGVSILRDDMRAAAVHRRLPQRGSAATARSRCSGATRASAQTDDPLALIQYLDLKTYLVGDINTKVDRASMAHSLEVREPLMDHPLVEWLATLPSSLKVRGQEGQVAAQEGDGAAPAAASSCTGRRWASPCRSRAGSAARCARACATRCWASGSATPACSTGSYLQAAGRPASVGTPRLQLVAVDAADVRRLPAQRRRYVGRRRRRPPRRREPWPPCASSTSSTTRFRCTAATRSGPRRSCASSARSAGRRCS